MNRYTSVRCFDLDVVADKLYNARTRDELSESYLPDAIYVGSTMRSSSGMLAPWLATAASAIRFIQTNGVAPEAYAAYGGTWNQLRRVLHGALVAEDDQVRVRVPGRLHWRAFAAIVAARDVGAYDIFPLPPPAPRGASVLFGTLANVVNRTFTIMVASSAGFIERIKRWTGRLPPVRGDDREPPGEFDTIAQQRTEWHEADGVWERALVLPQTIIVVCDALAWDVDPIADDDLREYLPISSVSPIDTPAFITWLRAIDNGRCDELYRFHAQGLLRFGIYVDVSSGDMLPSGSGLPTTALFPTTRTASFTLLCTIALMQLIENVRPEIRRTRRVDTITAFGVWLMSCVHRTAHDAHPRLPFRIDPDTKGLTADGARAIVEEHMRGGIRRMISTHSQLLRAVSACVPFEGTDYLIRWANERTRALASQYGITHDLRDGCGLCKGGATRDVATAHWRTYYLALVLDTVHVVNETEARTCAMAVACKALVPLMQETGNGTSGGGGIDPICMRPEDARNRETHAYSDAWLNGFARPLAYA